MDSALVYSARWPRARMFRLEMQGGRPDVVKECLSPPTSSSCRCKAWVHRGRTHTGSQAPL